MTTAKKLKSSDHGHEMVELTVNGITMLTTLTKKYKERKKWTKPDNRKIVSFIPGTVREVLVSVGDKVTENDKLLVLEAMKMMNVITSPVGGVISKIHIKQGDRVANGTVLIDIF